MEMIQEIDRMIARYSKFEDDILIKEFLEGLKEIRNRVHII